MTTHWLRLALAAAGVLPAATAARLLRLARLRRAFAVPLPGAWPYSARGELLSRGVRAFDRALREAVGDRFGVAVKVRLADVIGCNRGTWRLGYGRIIAQRHLDFVLFDPATTRVLFAVELDDRTHGRDGRRVRDAILDRALAAAGVPLLRVRAAAAYERAAIRVAVNRCLSRGSGDD
jgi:hypothetical protein